MSVCSKRRSQKEILKIKKKSLGKDSFTVVDKYSDLPLHSIYLSSKSHQAEALLSLYLGEDRSARGLSCLDLHTGSHVSGTPSTDFTLQKSPPQSAL